MALKCLNCHMTCAADDTACVFCGNKITNTATALKKDAPSNSGKGMSIMFMLVGGAIFNSVIGPQYFPNSGERILAAGAVGAVCAVVGLFFGQIISGD